MYIRISVAGFDWDEGNWPKCGRHGLTREEIEEAFHRGPDVHPDIRHSSVETRFLAIGTTARGRWVFVAFTLRIRDGGIRIRPIRARDMHEKEVRRYERQGRRA